MFAIILLLSIFGILLFYGARKQKSYWKIRNVSTGKMTPIVGDQMYLLLGTEDLAEFVQRMYNEAPGSRYSGAFQFHLPILVLKSPDLIKKICVKDFDNFVDHRRLVPEDLDILLSGNLFNLKGQAWKDMRYCLSPAFTSSKMKSMFKLMCNNANLFIQYYLEENKPFVEVEMKDASTRFATDVIASWAFGIEINSLKNRDNEFYTMGRRVNLSGTLKKMGFFLYQTFPIIGRVLKFPIFSDDLRNFFIDLVNDMIKMRRELNIKRPDMLGLLIEFTKGHHNLNDEEEQEDAGFAVAKDHFESNNVKASSSEKDIACQVFVFFLGGLETVSTAMCFLAYELAVNADVQKKLIEEIDENRPSDGTLSYEIIAKLTYLDMVVSETLRKWPSILLTDRIVTKPYTVEPEHPGETPLHLGTGDNIMVPIYGIHRDPKYYENPEKFQPDRFSPDNRKNIKPYTYLPFGVGPRNCIGSRFALLEIKALFFYLLSYFEIVPVEKTNIPLKVRSFGFSLGSANDFPLGLKRRVTVQ